MLYYNKIDISGSLYVNKTSASKGCIICHERSLLDKGFRFQPNVFNACHDILMMSINIKCVNI